MEESGQEAEVVEVIWLPALLPIIFLFM